MLQYDHAVTVNNNRRLIRNVNFVAAAESYQHIQAMFTTRDPFTCTNSMHLVANLQPPQIEGSPCTRKARDDCAI